MSSQGLAGLLGAVDPEAAAMQMAQKHSSSIIFSALIVLGILIIVISAITGSIGSSPHTKSMLFAGLGAFMVVGGGIAVYKAEKKNF